MNGKIVLSLAISLDGFIASESGGFEWITGDGDSSLNTKEGNDFAKFLEDKDIVVMGGECYRQGFAADYKDKTVYVATSKIEEDRDNLRFVNGDIVSPILEEQQAGKNIFLFGGGKVIDPFIKANVIDSYNIAIIPTLLGKGRKLFLDNNPTLLLHLDNYIVEDGTMIMTYSKRV